MSEYIDEVKFTKVSSELLIAANKIHGELNAEDRRERAVFLFKLFDYFKENEIEADTAKLATAITWRLEALARLDLKGIPELRVWQLASGEPGMVYTSEEIFEVAAEEELIEIENNMEFDAIKFVKNLMMRTEAHGRS